MPAATDEPQALAGRLLGHRAFHGAATVLFNAAVQRQAAEDRDRAGRPAFGGRVKPAEHPDSAHNDNHSPSSSSDTA